MHRLHVDHYFCIGSSHKRAGEPCEDYALSGTLEDGRVYGIVCDGCSGANARTDIGARVLCLAIEDELQQTSSLDACFPPAFVQGIRERLQTRPMGGTAQDYLASVVAFCADDSTAKVFMAGDGAFAVRRPDGSVDVTEVSWPDNAPYYLGYCLQPAVAAQFTLIDTKGASSVELCTHITGGDSQILDMAPHEFLKGWTTELNLQNVSALAVCSDGIGQISTLESLDAATACLAFKNFEGSFVKRRVMKALTQWEGLGRIPQDDFAISAMARVKDRVP